MTEHASAAGAAAVCRVDEQTALVDLLAAAGLRVPTASGARTPPLPLTWLALAARPLADELLRHILEGRTAGSAGPPAVVHISQRVRLAYPLRRGDVLNASARIVAARETPRGLAGRVRTLFTSRDQGSSVLLEPSAEVSSRFLISGGDLQSGAQAEEKVSPRSDGGPEQWLSVTLDQAAVAAFADLSGDHQPLHLDERAARDAGFAGPVVHGSLLVAAAEAALGEDTVPGPGAVELGVTFHAPVVAGPAPLRIGIGAPHRLERGRDGIAVSTTPLHLLDSDGRLAASGQLDRTEAAHDPTHP